jgi:hypothetical protein
LRICRFELEKVGRSWPETEALHVLALRELSGRARERDAPILEHHGAVRVPQRDASVLLCDDHADALSYD